MQGFFNLFSVKFLSTLSLRRATSQPVTRRARNLYFYPRSPCGERRYQNRDRAQSEQFLSTLSLRRATRPCDYTSPQTYISIHALLAESDQALRLYKPPDLYFYPRSPCGERPHNGGPWQGECKISIHALLAESDSRRGGQASASANFYPRSPCGERR